MKLKEKKKRKRHIILHTTDFSQNREKRNLIIIKWNGNLNEIERKGKRERDNS